MRHEEPSDISGGAEQVGATLSGGVRKQRRTKSTRATSLAKQGKNDGMDIASVDTSL